MKVCFFEIDGSQLLIADTKALFVKIGIQFSRDRQSVSRGRAANEIDNDFMAGQRLPPPVHADIAEHAMFDLVPLAGTGREVAYRKTQSGLVCKSLQRDLPQSHPVAVAAATITRSKELQDHPVK